MNTKVRILHIGNIANNAFLNAKILNQSDKFECDVLSLDYQHIMGCPEWEDAIFDSSTIDHFSPDWDNIDMNNYERPKWFFQGPKKSVLKKIIKIKSLRYSKPNLLKSFRKTIFLKIKRLLKEPFRILIKKPFKKFIKKPINKIDKKIIPPFIRRGLKHARNYIKSSFLITRHNLLVGRFNSELVEILSRDELSKLTKHSKLWKKLLKSYDIVHGYAYDGYYALAHNKLYVAFEHGTIRKIPFQKDYIGRLCKATYQNADHVIITNSDNIKAAKELQLSQYTYVPHPINEDHNKEIEYDDFLRQKYESKFTIFHPARHDWSSERDLNWDKGNDILIHGFADFIKETGANAKIILANWGRHVNKSKALIKTLDIEENIDWISPQPHPLMMSYIRISDIVADQFTIGAFGSIMPKSMMAGTPCMIYLDTTLLTWCFPEPPPILNCKTKDEVKLSLCKCYRDSGYMKQISVDGISWYNNYHSNELIFNKLSKIYNSIV